MTTEEMLILDGVASPSFKEWMQTRPRPARMFGKDVPATLDGLTYGELVELQMCGESTSGALISLCRVILGVDNVRKILRCDAAIMAGFIFWATSEVERISRLFASVQRPPTAEEIQAGILKIDTDPLFDLADWYALRMGMTNHDDAFNTKWIRIYKCLSKDRGLEDFRSNLTKIRMTK